MRLYRTRRTKPGASSRMLRTQNRRLMAENRRLRESRQRYRHIFAQSRVVLWEEDFSRVKREIERLRSSGVEDFDTYFDHHPGKVYELMRLIRVLDVNPAGPELFRAPSKHHLIGSLEKMFAPGSFPFVKGELIAIAEGRDYYEGETVGTTFDGQTVHLLVTMDIPSTGKRYRNVLVSMMDITPRKQREEERDRLMQGLEQEKLRSEILREITLVLTSRVDQTAILDTILGQAARLVPFDSGNIRLRSGDYLETARWYGYDDYGAEEFIAGFREHIDSLGLARKVMKDSHAVIVNDTRLEPDWVRFPETAYIRSIMVLPIATARKFYGLLSIENAAPNMYDAGEVQKLQPLADAAAIALEKAELYAELKEELAERKRVESQLEHSLAQKETLLREIHHRVKNNLAMVVSLINLQSSQLDDESLRELLDHIRSKIYSISLIHEKLYRSHDLQHIELRDYAEELLEALRSVVAEEETAEVAVEIETGIVLDIEQAIPLALIITELFTNSYKYAQGAPCSFSLRARRSAGEVEVWVSDNGPGFPEDFSIEESETLGLLLVRNLAEQLGGDARVTDPSRAEIRIRFPLLMAQGSDDASHSGS